MRRISGSPAQPLHQPLGPTRPLPVCVSGPTTHRWAPPTTLSPCLLSMCLPFHSIPFRCSPLPLTLPLPLSYPPRPRRLPPSSRRFPRTGDSDSCPAAADSARFGAFRACRGVVWRVCLGVSSAVAGEMGVGSSAGRPNGSPRSERGTGGRQGSAAVSCWIRLCVSSSSSSSSARAKVDTAAATARAVSGNASPILTLSSSASVSLGTYVCLCRL